MFVGSVKAKEGTPFLRNAFSVEPKYIGYSFILEA